jgi:ribosomal silencing factor RsfS
MISYVARAVGSEKAEDICSIDVKERLKKWHLLKKKKIKKRDGRMLHFTAAKKKEKNYYNQQLVR